MFFKAMILLCLLVCVFFSFSYANDGTSPSIYSVMQESQSACITLEIVSNGEPGIDDSYDLTRTNGGQVEYVFTDRTFAPTEAYDSVKRCRDWGTAFNCEKYPSECWDCDGDGVQECYGWCETAYYICLSDLCLEPGNYVYSLINHDLDYDSKSITIIDSVPVDECVDTSAVCGDCAEIDHGSDESPSANNDDAKNDSDDDDDGCGCSVAPGSEGSGLFLMMMGIGILALFISRRKIKNIRGE